MVNSFPNPFTWYRLTIDQVPGRCLDVVNDGRAHEDGKLQMASIGNYSGQHWQFLPSPEGSFCLRTMYTGSDMLLVCDDLDPHLSRTSTIPARWYLERPPGNNSSNNDYFNIRADLPDAAQGKFYLRPQDEPSWFNGKRLRVIRINSDNESDLWLKTQLWKLTEIEPIVDPTYTISPLISPETTGGWTNIRTSEYQLTDGGAIDMVTDDIEGISLVIKRLSALRTPLGWAYMLDPPNNKLLYLDIHKLQWLTCDASHPTEAVSEGAPCFEFYPWRLTNSGMSHAALLSYLDSFNSTSTIIVDVSGGFCNPRIVESTSNFRPPNFISDQSSFKYTEEPPTYSSEAVLLSHKTDDTGLNYVFYVRAGVVIAKLDDTPESEPGGSLQEKWTCQILGDRTTFMINPSSLFRVGQEDAVPQGFVWCKEGENVQFPSDIVPVQHLAYLGHGGHAVVDKVLCSGRVFARKQIRTNQRLPLSVATEELQSIKKIQGHWHIIKVVGSYVRRQTLGIILHPAAECDLESALERYPETDGTFFQGRSNHVDFVSKLWAYFGCLANGLAYMHAMSIRHRDIKPRNILVTYGGPLYTDFGIARDFSDSLASTTTGPTTKTYEYCAPEVADGAERGRSSDIFSLGCVFLEMLTVLMRCGTFQDCKIRRRAENDSSFHANMDQVGKWIESISQMELQDRGIAENGRIQLLFVIRKMLDPDRTKRPLAMDLWKFTKDLTIESEQSTGRVRFCGHCCFSMLDL